MKDDLAAFEATVLKLNDVPSRKLTQIILEVPIEWHSRIAVICPHGAHVAVARLDSEVGHQPAVREPASGAPAPDKSLPKGSAQARAFRDMKASQQAGILCNDSAFWQFLTLEYNCPAHDANSAAKAIRGLLGVTSRADIDDDDDALWHWKEIVEEYRAWQQAPAVVPA